MTDKLRTGSVTSRSGKITAHRIITGMEAALPLAPILGLHVRRHLVAFQIIQAIILPRFSDP